MTIRVTTIGVIAIVIVGSLTFQLIMSCLTENVYLAFDPTADQNPLFHIIVPASVGMVMIVLIRCADVVEHLYHMLPSEEQTPNESDPLPEYDWGENLVPGERPIYRTLAFTMETFQQTENDIDVLSPHLVTRPTTQMLYDPVRIVVPEPDSQDNETATDRGNRCGVCLNRKKKCAFVPCGHFVGCVPCAREYFSDSGNTRCWICKAPVSQIIRIFDS
jgi:hypothetical protein